MAEYIDKELFKSNLEVDCYGRTDIVKVGIALDRAKVEPIQTWIPVTERLPDYGQEVIAYSGNILKPCVYGCFYWNKDFQNWAHITHWMPLPEQPKEVEQ